MIRCLDRSARAPCRLVVAIAAVCMGTPTAHAAAASCSTLDACIASVHALAKLPHNYAVQLSDDEQRLTVRLLSFDGAVPRLIPLLADPDENVANIAAAALRDAKFIDPAYLPQIKAGLDRGLGWLAPALGRMPSDDAAREAVARLLVSEDAPYNQEAYAVELAGKRAIPFIVEAARCRKGCTSEQVNVLGEVLGDMGPDRALAAPGLMTIAQDPAVTHSVAVGALSMIGSLKQDGRPLERQLVELGDKFPDLAGAVDQALVGIGSERAGDIFTRWLQTKADIIELRDLAATGAAGRTAGPELVHLLADPDWEVRIGAAQAIGYIGYRQGADALIGVLGDPSDVRLTWVAVQSLGRLRAVSAVSALTVLAREHWYPPVRQAAALALKNIDTGDAYPAIAQGNFAMQFFRYEDIGHGLATCSAPSVAAKPEPTDRKLYTRGSKRQLENMAYPVTIYSYGPASIPDAKPDEDRKVIKVTPENMVEHRTPRMQVPQFALRVDQGWLAGSSRGEWGGELVHVDDQGATQLVLNGNSEDAYFLGDDIVAVTGLAHLFSNRGMLYKVNRAADGAWRATPWRALTGAPVSSWLVASGELLVNVEDGGSILVSAHGQMRMAPCASSR